MNQMQKATRLMILLAFLVSIASVQSCKKEKIKGCMDRDSKNYNATAEEDDGTCRYEGSIVFWSDKATADLVVANGATAFTYYIDGILVGSSAASVYWSGAPNCGQSGSITIKKDLGSNKNKISTFSIKDQDGDEYWSGTVNFTANNCTSYQLEI
jgi:hypothetical protein